MENVISIVFNCAQYLYLIQLDSSSFFHDLTPGVENDGTGIIVLLAAAKLLGDMKRNVSRLCSPLQNKIIRSCSADYSLFVCLLTGSNRLSSKNSPFQNKFKCKTVLVKMSFICLQVKNQYHVKNFVPTILDRIK